MSEAAATVSSPVSGNVSGATQVANNLGTAQSPSATAVLGPGGTKDKASKAAKAAKSSQSVSRETTPATNVQDAAQKASEATGKEVEVTKVGPEKYELKIDGQTLQKEYTKDQVTQLLQKALAADKRFDEAANLRKSAESAISLLQSRPDLALRELGYNVDELAEQFVANKIRYEMMTPDQKRAADAERRVQEMLEREQYQKQQQEEQQREFYRQKYLGEYQKSFIDTLKTAGLPQTKETVARMARYMERAVRQGFKDITPQDVVSMVKEDYQNEHKQLFSSMDAQKLIDMFGKDLADKMLKHSLAQVKNPAQQRPQVLDVPEREPQRKRHWISEKEWDNSMRKRFGK